MKFTDALGAISTAIISYGKLKKSSAKRLLMNRYLMCYHVRLLAERFVAYIALEILLLQVDSEDVAFQTIAILWLLTYGA